jgi:hypothetical protein
VRAGGQAGRRAQESCRGPVYASAAPAGPRADALSLVCNYESR